MITISVDNDVILTIDDDMLNMMAYSYPKDNIKNVIINNILNVINQKLEEGKKALQIDWTPQIRQKYDSMPTQDLDIANMIYAEPNYQDYDQRNKSLK